MPSCCRPGAPPAQAHALDPSDPDTTPPRDFTPNAPLANRLNDPTA